MTARRLLEAIGWFFLIAAAVVAGPAHLDRLIELFRTRPCPVCGRLVRDWARPCGAPDAPHPK